MSDHKALIEATKTLLEHVKVLQAKLKALDERVECMEVVQADNVQQINLMVMKNAPSQTSDHIVEGGPGTLDANP